uniref:Uncharacterized protein n=1 Tax=Panagrolaimus superbus TaxID=310955 RepID=A0A914YLN3_9BILA
MEFLNFFIFAAFLFFGILAQRFQRHVNNTKLTVNGTLIDRLNNSFPDIPNELAADQLPGVQEGDDVRLIRPGGIEIELKYGELKFEFCSDGCLEKIVVVCFDCENCDLEVQGECGPNRCEFKAGV